MDLKEAYNKINELENKLNLYLDLKEVELLKTIPKSIIKSDIGNCGKKEDKLSEYVTKIIEYDKEIDSTQEEMFVLNDYVEKELKRLNKYNELAKQIIFYKEQYIAKENEKITWKFISKKVYASESTCRRIYKKSKKKRNIN